MKKTELVQFKEEYESAVRNVDEIINKYEEKLDKTIIVKNNESLVTVSIGKLSAGYECYDIVVANILAEVLVPLTPVITHQLKKGGIYITSGIIDDKEEVVKQAVEQAGLEILEVTYQGEWVSVTARKN